MQYVAASPWGRLPAKLAWAAVVLLATRVVDAGGMKEINPPHAPKSTRTLALVGGRLIDGRGGSPVSDSAIVVRGTKILAAGAHGKVKIPSDARTIDATGLSVLPGLIDSHFHSANDVKTPVEYELRHGVTSFRDPGHPFRFYRAVMQTDLTMPRVFLCGAHLDAHPPAWPDQAVVVKDAEHARRTVHAHVDRGASAVKVYFRLPLDHIKAACDAASERGVLVTAHLELIDADDAIRAGVRGIEHVTSFGTALADPNEAKRFKAAVSDDSAARRPWRYRLWTTLNLDASPRVEPLVETIVKHGVFVSPTLTTFERRAGQQGGAYAEGVAFANMLKFIGQCHRGGAKVVVGSHPGGPCAERGRA